MSQAQIRTDATIKLLSGRSTSVDAQRDTHAMMNGTCSQIWYSLNLIIWSIPILSVIKWLLTLCRFLITKRLFPIDPW